jgi:hypothetical protein
LLKARKGTDSVFSTEADFTLRNAAFQGPSRRPSAAKAIGATVRSSAYAVVLGLMWPITSPAAVQENSRICSLNFTENSHLSFDGNFDQKENNFIRVDLLPPDTFRAEEEAPRHFQLITLNNDVLRPAKDSGHKVVSSTNRIFIRSVFCVAFQPEMIVLVIENRGEKMKAPVIEISVIYEEKTSKLLGHLPAFEQDQIMRFLCSSSEPLAEAHELAIAIHDIEEISDG